jgi:hypothetical protein
MPMTRTSQVIGGNSVTVVTTGQDPKLCRIEGYCNGSTNTQYFIQLFNTAPTGGATPLRSLQVVGGYGFTFDYTSAGGLSLVNLPNWSSSGGLVVVLSGTDATYTSTAATCDINVDVEEYELEPQLAVTTVASGATASGKKTILADGATNTQALMSLTVTETGGAASYVQLFCKSPSVNDWPLLQFSVAANSTTYFKFGSNGRKFIQVDANNTVHKGYYVGISLTSNSFDGAGSANVGGTYQ